MNNNIIMIYFLVLNLIGFVVMWKDKRAAIKKQWRTKESTIFIIAILGGSLGILGGMNLFRHKTKHKKFIYGIPFIILIQLIGYVFLTY